MFCKFTVDKVTYHQIKVRIPRRRSISFSDEPPFFALQFVVFCCPKLVVVMLSLSLLSLCKATETAALVEVVGRLQQMGYK
jgi:hypothetical protein